MEQWLNEDDFKDLDTFIEQCTDEANPIPVESVDEILNFVDEVEDVKLRGSTIFVGVLHGNQDYDAEVKKVLDDFGVQYNEVEIEAFSKLGDSDE